MTIRKRDDCDGYQVDVTLKSGQRVRRQATNMTEAKRVEALLLDASNEWLTLDDALAAYVDYLRVRAKPASVAFAQLAQTHVLRLVDPVTNVASPPARLVEGFIEGRRAEGVSDATINGNLRILRAALRLAETQRRINRAPAVKLLREGRRIPSTLTLTQVDALAQGAEDFQTRLAIYVAAHTGMRHQEILHLQWGDVGATSIRVSRKADWSPKNHHEREVPLSPKLTAMLHSLPIRYRLTPQTWLFQRPGGGRLQTIHRQVAEAFKRARLWDPKTKPGLHMLRRTFASTLLTSGVDLETVKELGGWADIKTVQLYLASNDDVKRSAVLSVFGG